MSSAAGDTKQDFHAVLVKSLSPAGGEETLSLGRVDSKHSSLKTDPLLDFPGGSMVKNLPASAGDTGSIRGLGRSHMPGATKPRHHNCWDYFVHICLLHDTLNFSEAIEFQLSYFKS